MIKLKEQYGKRYKVTPCACEGEHPGDPFRWQEIVGKRGYIRRWGENELELYITSTHIAARIERLYKHFKPKNHYDDATAFVFSPEHLPEACRWIKAKNRRQMTPEALERAKAHLLLAHSLKPKAP